MMQSSESSISSSLAHWRTVEIVDDGDILRVVYNPPLSEEDLANFEWDHHIRLPHQSRELYSYTNGCSFFGLDIMPIEAVTVFENHGLVTFHNWGNGDFDCLAAKDGRGYTVGDVVFVNHRPDVLVKISASLLEWFKTAFNELKTYGTVYHPVDYRRLELPSGLYRDVLRSLAGVDCELNK